MVNLGKNDQNNTTTTSGTKVDSNDIENFATLVLGTCVYMENRYGHVVPGSNRAPTSTAMFSIIETA